MTEEQNGRAACLGADPEVFFPADFDSSAVRQAKAICATCPLDVADACLDIALSSRDMPGVWGGTTHYERRELRRMSREERAA